MFKAFWSSLTGIHKLSGLYGAPLFAVVGSILAVGIFESAGMGALGSLFISMTQVDPNHIADESRMVSSWSNH